MSRTGLHSFLSAQWINTLISAYMPPQLINGGALFTGGVKLLQEALAALAKLYAVAFVQTARNFADVQAYILDTFKSSQNFRGDVAGKE